MEINYLIFAPAWSLLALAPLILTSLGKFSHSADTGAVRWALLGLEGLTMLFWLSGFVALGVFLSGRICFGMVRINHSGYGRFGDEEMANIQLLGLRCGPCQYSYQRRLVVRLDGEFRVRCCGRC